MAVVLLVATSVAVVTGLLKLRSDTSPESFLPHNDPSLSSLEDAARSFGGDPIIVLVESSEPLQLLGTDQLPKMLALEGELVRLPNVATVYGPATVLNQIAASAQNLLATLAGRRDVLAAQAEQQARSQGASEQKAAAARDDAVAAFDQRYGALLVQGLPAGLPTLHNPNFVTRVIFDQAGAPRPQWALVVPKPNAVAILVRPRETLDQTGTERLVSAVRSTVDHAGLTTTRTTVTGVPAVTAALGNRIRLEIPLLGALAVVLIAVCYLLVPWIRPRRYRLVPLVTTLCATALVLAAFGWLSRPLSLGVIAFLPILVGIASDYPAYLTQPGPRRQVIVAAFASSTAFASLAISPLPFVRDLGLALAGGLLVALGLGLVVGRRLVRMASISSASPVAAHLADLSERPRVPVWKRISILAAVVTVASLGWFALPHVEIEAQPDRLASGLSALDDVSYAQQTLGGSGEVQLVMRGPDVLAPDALAWMKRTEDQLVLQYGNQLKAVLSPSSLFSFLGASPTPQEVAAGTQLLPSYLTNSVVRGDRQRATMIFLLKLQDLHDQKLLFDSVRSVIPPPPHEFDIDLVGLPVVAARGYQLLVELPYLPSLVGIFSAGLVLLIGLRRRSDALRAVFAAGLATGWGLGAVWVLGMSVTPLTLALGSLTTATACEFTVMLSSGLSGRRLQLHRTVLAAAMAAALGYAALAASRLEMVREFGLLMAGSVGLSFVAARLVVVLIPWSHTRAHDQIFSSWPLATEMKKVEV
ncbi:RND transporter [Frankia sp. CiP1_Cm_nod2]|uniref:RND transporter n=1 Tax=Frankia sp. CiP1_Cm_nod2 TaxID=2897161 RepID=UPI00202452D0